MQNIVVPFEKEGAGIFGQQGEEGINVRSFVGEKQKLGIAREINFTRAARLSPYVLVYLPRS